jgi:hypothetical protein
MTESRRASKALAIAAAWALLPGCPKSEPPRELRLELPELITSKDPVVIHARATRQDGTPQELSDDLAFSVSPPELATLGKHGFLSCARSGDGSVSLNVGGVVGRAKLSCKLVARIELADKLSLDAAAGEIEPRISVLDAAGKELELPLSITSDNSSVVQARSGRLLPGEVGSAKLTITAGQLTKQVAVEVVRTLQPEVVPIDQNRRISYSLDAGKYRLSLALPSPHQVTVDWLGAPYCAYRGNGTQHTSDCTLQAKGGVSFDNPAFLLNGDKAPSLAGVTLREVP